MSSTMVASAPGEPGRMSQLLPTVKCSTCHRPVPLSELGDHTCTAPPPVPALPKPSVPPNQMNNLLPPRLQGRVANPPPAQGNPPRGPPPQHQRIGSAASERLRVNTNTTGPASAGFRSSPLARAGSLQVEDDPTNLSDPFRARPPATADPRLRNNSFSAGFPSPAPPRSAGSPLNGPPPSLNQNRSPPGRTGTPQMPPPNSAPVGLPASPRSTGRPSFSGAIPPINRNASPAPSHMSIPRNQPSPAPSMTRNGGPGSMGPPRGPPSQGPPTGLPPPRPLGPPNPQPPGMLPNAPPGGPPGRNGVPFPGGPPQQGMPPRPPFAGHTPQRSYAPSLPSAGRPTHVMAPSTASFAGPVAEDIDTRSGGEAGMAGVGRKGFAAVARAAMFAAPLMRPQGPQDQPNRRPEAPRFLDIDAASRSTDTPPLSAGSGYSSSRSPGPPSPLAQTQFPPSEPNAEKMPGRIPTPPRIDTSVPNPSTSSQTPVDKDKTPVPSGTPASAFGIRLPFFEKLKGMVPGSSSPVDTTPTLTTTFDAQQKSINHNDRSTPTPTPPQPRPTPPPPEPSHSRNKSTSSSRHKRDDSDGSEYSGLAYAASTDYGDDNRSRTSMASSRSGSQRKRDLPPVPPLPSKDLSSSPSGNNRGVHFSSSSVSSSGRDRSDPIPIGRSAGDVVRPGHSRNTSTSSYSSTSSVDSPPSGDGPKRKNSTAIAMALGLSQTPPADYSKLGGPGGPTRISRLERKASESSIGSRSVYSRTASVAPAAGASAFDMLERTMLKNDRDVRDKSRERTGRPRAETNASDVSKSRSVGSGRQRTAGGSSMSESAGGLAYAASEYGSVAGSVASGSRAHRSNTVQGISSPESKAPKLPTRAKTTTAENASGTVDGSKPKERRKKEKVCVKCRKLIDDGRWIQVDTGGILCERCWKNMYLPKCRRCNLPIEKQAVSSSDGQLKGKYHKECFSCHTCHKPFPDKTFYVFDGKPFCAYHYHEANDSLCAAARCGQPIEGPCAVSHAGDRYHPDCMTCEYPGYPECREKLREYFEVDGRMLCERHASSGADEDGEWASTKATRRITRFIDLNATNNGGGGGDDGDSALR